MNEEYNPSAGIEDLLSEEEEIFTNQPTRIKTGVGTNIVESRPKSEGVRPDAKRWLFNPFEVIDLTNEPTTCGIRFLENVVFNEIQSIEVDLAKTDAYELPGATHNPDNYSKFKRTSLMIATELCDKNGDKGVVMVSGLLGEDADSAAGLNTVLFGDEVDCITDIDNPEHPCPVLPNLLESLDRNVQANIKTMGAEDRTAVLKAHREVRDSIAMAMRNARARIDEAQKRILDTTNPNRNLSNAEKRCYLCLGLEIPNVMPFLTPQAAAGMNQGIDSEALGRGIAAGMAAATAPPVAEKKAESVKVAKADLAPGADFTVNEDEIDGSGDSGVTATCAATTAKGEPCRSPAESDGFCKNIAHNAEREAAKVATV